MTTDINSNFDLEKMLQEEKNKSIWQRAWNATGVIAGIIGLVVAYIESRGAIIPWAAFLIIECGVLIAFTFAIAQFYRFSKRQKDIIAVLKKVKNHPKQELINEYAKKIIKSRRSTMFLAFCLVTVIVIIIFKNMGTRFIEPFVAIGFFVWLVSEWWKSWRHQDNLINRL